MEKSESELKLEEILSQTSMPKEKIKKALSTMNYLALQDFSTRLDNADRSVPYTHRMSEEKGVIESISGRITDAKYRILNKAMSDETRKEAKRLLPQYREYISMRASEDSYIERRIAESIDNIADKARKMREENKEKVTEVVSKTSGFFKNMYNSVEDKVAKLLKY